MALYKRNNTGWSTITHNGKRIQRSSGTSDKITALMLHDQIKSEVWRSHHLDIKPEKTWVEAGMRWLSESRHKRSLRDDKVYFRWLDKHLKSYKLSEITRNVLDDLSKLKLKEGVKPASANRMLALIRAILHKAVREWEWLEKSPCYSFIQRGYETYSMDNA